MKERPILFSSSMVRAILDGRKTQTRRTVRHDHIAEADIFASAPGEHGWEFGVAGEGGVFAHGDFIRCPYGAPGDHLWVRETFTHITGNGLRVWYRADGEPTDRDGNILPTRPGTPRWRPSIFMRRKESRITLEVTEVRVQRLQEISEDDCEAEGLTEEDTRCDGECGATPCMLLRPAFQRLWDSINGKPRPMLDDDGEPVLDDEGRPRMVASRSWASNPWIWAVSFRRLP